MPHLHKGQKDVWDDPARFLVLDAGRRWGKSRLGGLLSLTEALQAGRWWWVWPNYPNSAVGWRMLKHLGLQIPTAQKNEVDRLIHFGTGGWVQIKSADKPDSLRSEGLDGVIVDEAAHIRRFKEMWEQALRPALSDRKGRAVFISSPKGFNDFFELFQMGDSGAEDWSAYQFPTWTNPFIDPDEIEAAKRDLPELVFRQEYGAEFVQLAGALFKREYFRVVDDEPATIRQVRYWDLAVSTKTSADYTCGVKVGVTSDGTIVIVDVQRGRWEWPTALRIIGDTSRMDGPSVTQGVEDVGMQKGMYQMLLAEPSLANIPFVPVKVTTDKMTRATPWLARAEQGKVVLVRGGWNAAWLDEVCGFPESAHDDQVDGTSGSVSMLGTGGGHTPAPAERVKLETVSRWTQQTKPRWTRRRR
jgi:predicted phage terminase large subunit-like protein